MRGSSASEKSIHAESGRSHLSSARSIQSASYLLDHPKWTTTNVVVGEANLEVARGFDLDRPLPVAVDLRLMLHTVDLDGQSSGDTGEVRDVTSDRHLSAELPAV